MIFVYLLYLYLLIGIVFAGWFAFFKAGLIDEGAAKTPAGFKLIIMPAAIILWPVILAKISRS